MKRTTSKKIFKRLACVFGACAFAVLGCLPFIPSGKASAEGDLIYPDYPFADTFHNPFGGAIFSRVVSDDLGNYNSFANTLPERLNISRDLPSVDGVFRDYDRFSYRISDSSSNTSYVFRDYIDGISDTGNFTYYSEFPSQIPIDREVGDLLWSFSFDRCFMSLFEFQQFRISHRYLYRSDAGVGWNSDNQIACRLQLVSLSCAVQMIEGNIEFVDALTDSNSFLVYSQGYHYPFANIAVNQLSGFVYDDPSIIGSDDAVEVPMVWVSGRFECIATLSGNYSVVNTQVLPYISGGLTQKGGYLMWQEFYDALLYERLNNLAIENNRLSFENERLNTIIDSNALQVIYDIVEGFLQLELFPSFRIYMLLLISLGLMGFGLGLKLIM